MACSNAPIKAGHLSMATAWMLPPYKGFRADQDSIGKADLRLIIQHEFPKLGSALHFCFQGAPSVVF